MTAQQWEYPVGRARLVLPQGAWESLDTANEAVTLLPEPNGQISLQTRLVALRGAQGQLLAVLRVQTNRTNEREPAVHWTGSCPPQQGVFVDDVTAGSRVRQDCLRLKRWVHGTQWLNQNHPAFARALQTHGLTLGQPHSHIHHHYTTASGAMVTVDALIDQRLLTPPVRTNEDFLVAGRPALQWGHDLARAVRVSTGMMDGYLAIPPFPFAAPGS
ncbi:hypothetical protein [Oryzisolibacter sp. LB2S]|uniref:hypothetical protein n=1 Tax=Alicycliphilus soli TaxID=3228789 RepID=UPI003459A0BF